MLISSKTNQNDSYFPFDQTLPTDQVTAAADSKATPNSVETNRKTTNDEFDPAKLAIKRVIRSILNRFRYVDDDDDDDENEQK